MSTSLISPVSVTETNTSDEALVDKLVKSYQADQQLKYLHLHAEVEMLLQQLKTIQQKKQLN